jgi:hypothetical protein
MKIFYSEFQIMCRKKQQMDSCKFELQGADFKRPVDSVESNLKAVANAIYYPFPAPGAPLKCERHKK